MNHEPSSARETVLQAIENNELKPRSRAYFALCGLLSVAGSLVVALALMFTASLVVFSAERSGIIFAPTFGLAGWYAFFASLPWLLIIGCAGFVIILEILVRRHRFAYRRPLLYSIGVIFLFTLAAGWWVAKTPLHPLVVQYGANHEPRFIAPLYNRFSLPTQGRIQRGRVEGLTDSGFVVVSRHEQATHVILTAQTRIIPPTTLTTGTMVVIFGKLKPGGFEAFGVKIIHPEPWDKEE